MHTISISPALIPSSVIGLGTGLFGSDITRDDSFAILDIFHQAGGSMIDTAHVYAAWITNGAGMSERTVGAWIRSRGVRQHMLVATKGCHPLLSDMAAPRMDPLSLAQDLHESLDRLGDSSIDLYWLHRDDPAVPVDEILDALDAQRRAGRTRAFGASNWSAARLAAAQVWAKRNGVEGLCASQIEWSLATRDRTLPGDPTCLSLLSEDFAYHQRSQLPLVAYSAQAQGFFDTARVKQLPVYDAPANHARRERAIALGQRHQVSANHMALGWLTNQVFPVVALVGCRTTAQIVDSMAAADLHLTPDDVATLSGPQRW